MSQQEIYDLLKANPGKWFDAAEIAKNIEIRENNIRVGLQKIRWRNELVFKSVPGKNGQSKYVYMFPIE